jgi:hypothetical protein
LNHSEKLKRRNLKGRTRQTEEREDFSKDFYVHREKNIAYIFASIISSASANLLQLDHPLRNEK